MTMFYAREGGGVRTYLTAKARWLAQRPQIQHTLVGSALRTPNDVSFIAVPSAPLALVGGYRIPRSISTVARTVRALEPSLIEVGDPYQFAWAAARVKRSCTIPLVAFYHSDVATLVGRRFGTLARRAAVHYLRAVYRRFDLVMAPSRLMADRLRDAGVERVVHQPLGVDTSLFAPGYRNDNLRVQLGLPASVRLLVYAGRFTQEKKLPLLIDALHRLGPSYHLLLIGSGDAITASPQISHIPFQTDSRRLAGWIGGCDLLVHPGDQETFGLVVLEAMACGIPVLGVAAGGVAELIDDGNGMLVAPGSSAALAQGIDDLFSGDLVELGRNARENVCRRYDWNLIVPQILGHYGCLFASRQRTDLEARLAYACR